MTRLEWLKKRHSQLDTQVAELEQERSHIRDSQHKAALVDLKKQRLAVKTEIVSLET